MMKRRKILLGTVAALALVTAATYPFWPPRIPPSSEEASRELAQAPPVVIDRKRLERVYGKDELIENVQSPSRVELFLVDPESNSYLDDKDGDPSGIGGYTIVRGPVVVSDADAKLLSNFFVDWDDSWSFAGCFYPQVAVRFQRAGSATDILVFMNGSQFEVGDTGVQWHPIIPDRLLSVVKRAFPDASEIQQLKPSFDPRLVRLFGSIQRATMIVIGDNTKAYRVDSEKSTGAPAPNVAGYAITSDPIPVDLGNADTPTYKFLGIEDYLPEGSSSGAEFEPKVGFRLRNKRFQYDILVSFASREFAVVHESGAMTTESFNTNLLIPYCKQKFPNDAEIQALTDE